MCSQNPTRTSDEPVSPPNAATGGSNIPAEIENLASLDSALGDVLGQIVDDLFDPLSAINKAIDNPKVEILTDSLKNTSGYQSPGGMISNIITKTDRKVIEQGQQLKDIADQTSNW